MGPVCSRRAVENIEDCGWRAVLEYIGRLGLGIDGCRDRRCRRREDRTEQWPDGCDGLRRRWLRDGAEA